MDRDAVEAINIFGDLVTGFGWGHAKIYLSLKGGEPKTARQLIEETGLVRSKTYSALNYLLERGIVRCTDAHPANYQILNPDKFLNDLLRKTITRLNNKRMQLRKLNANGNGDADKEYLIKINGTQTRIIDYTNRAQVKDKDEARQIKRVLDRFIDELEHK